MSSFLGLTPARRDQAMMMLQTRHASCCRQQPPTVQDPMLSQLSRRAVKSLSHAAASGWQRYSGCVHAEQQRHMHAGCSREAHGMSSATIGVLLRNALAMVTGMNMRTCAGHV